jgi:hypothetical protein
VLLWVAACEYSKQLMQHWLLGVFATRHCAGVKQLSGMQEQLNVQSHFAYQVVIASMLTHC